MKNKILIGSFCTIVFGFFLLNIFTKDLDISYSERRKLQTFPKVTIDNLLDSSFFDKFDTYTLDQFVYRNELRNLKANIEFNILNKSDNNNIYLINNNVFKMEYVLNTDNIKKNTDKINYLINKYFTNSNIYYTIIPDKNYYNNSNKYLKLDYNSMFNEINNNLKDINYIDITSCLELNDYYLTDSHWKQENLNKIIKELLNNMNINYQDIDYTKNNYNKFYGAYYNEAALNIKPDSLVYLESEYTKNAYVKHLEYKNINTVYNSNNLGGIDSYSVYLNGASSIIEITNDKSLNDKELIIFRDSFGSSIVPLLIPYYNKITLVDIRYINSDLLKEYINFNNQDILFLYSTLIYNSNILK